MRSKLTIRLDDDVINKAKNFSNKKGKSLSKLVSDYITFLILEEEKETKVILTPIVKTLYGILKDSAVNERDYKKHLKKNISL